MNPLFLIDFYKVGHVSQYPAGTTQVWSNWTPRNTRIAGEKGVVFFGLQYFIQEILQWEFIDNFFMVPLEEVLSEYKELIKATLGVENPKTDHIEALHKLGYLPLDIYALPEGTSVEFGIPALVITNTVPEAFWLPNYIETVLSNMLWIPCTSASTAKRYRKIFKKWAVAAGETDFGFIDWQGHDFSYRGLPGREAAVLSGMGHLLSFSGTDTVPAILAARSHYGAKLSVGGSVPATEHSVMCAGQQDGEFETFRHLIEDLYPMGVVSIVSDTWDLWKVLTDYIPRLKDTILKRNGKVVIRPDSGDPSNILCGDPNADLNTPADLGTLRLLRNTLGTTGKMINNAGAIYGDSITVERADEILGRIVNELDLSPYNQVFGIGSYTYQYVTRDTYGFAMKATAVRINGKLINIFKKPVTDNSGKASHKGIPAVYRTTESTEENPKYFVQQESKPEQLDNCAFNKVFSNGDLLVYQTFDEIRKRVRA